MANQVYGISIQAEGDYMGGTKTIIGSEIHSTWAAGVLGSFQNPSWGLSTENWLQVKDVTQDYAFRYNSLDVGLDDYIFESTVVPSGTGNYEVGVLFRFKDVNNFYYITMNGGYQDWSGKNIRLMKKSGSTHTRLADYTHPVFTVNTDYHFKVTVTKGRIEVLLNGTKIFDYTDAFYIPTGAFGPIVKGQQFAKWKNFVGDTAVPFLIIKQSDGYAVDSIHHDPASATLIFPEKIVDFMKSELDAYMVGKSYTTIRYRRFVASSKNARVQVVFNKIPGANTTTNPDSLLYAYQVLPTSPPIPVTDLKGIVLDEYRIRLNWTHVDSSEDGFYIVDENDELITTVGENVFEYIETGLTPGTTYKRRVIPFNYAGQAAPSNEIVVTTKDILPEAPINFYAEVINDNQIKWMWEDRSNNEAIFEIIERSEDGNIVVVGIAEKDQTEWIEKNLKPSTEYRRAVRAKNSAGVSALSNEEVATTKDELPDPPQFAPMNFTGVGISHEEIFWSWLDINPKIDGFRIYDENDKMIKQVTKDFLTFTESGLYSDVEYKRRISAFNAGGESPKTPFVYARTMLYGYHRDGTPLEPFNLVASDITKNDVVLTWEYEEHPYLPAVGFRIYDELDQIIDVVPVEMRSRKIQNLIADTAYTFYVVAFNDQGDSLPSNIVQITTQKIESSEPPIDIVIPEENIDTYYGVEHDEETEETPKISAFHSGVGDNLDLIIRPLQESGFEEFQYEMYIVGSYKVAETFYPVVPFKYRLKFEGERKDGTLYTDTTEWIQATVQGSDEPKDPYSMLVTMKPIPNDVEVKRDGYTIELIDDLGNTLPAYTPESPQRINWSLSQVVTSVNEGFVEAIDMSDVFTNWIKFSHRGATQPAYVNELNTWVYDEITQEIKATVNSTSYMGAISPYSYDNYDTTMRLRSNDNDNDRMGFVLAFAVDENGRQHTLSALRNHESSAWDWALYYNYMQDNQKMLASMNIEPSDHKSWSAYYPDGTFIRAVRSGDDFTVYTSLAGKTEILESTKLTVNLTSLPELAIFRGAKQIGIAVQSQQGGSLMVEHFEGERSRTMIENYLIAWTSATDKKYTIVDWEGTKTISQPVRVDALSRKDFVGKIQSPAYQIPWQEVAKQHEFLNNSYRLIVTSLNPNVRLFLNTEVDEFFPTDSTFVKVDLSAEVINPMQTSWHPMVHSGYYYINQREYFLYADDKVFSKDDNQAKKYMYDFPYVIRVYGERYDEGGIKHFTDDTTKEYILGHIQEGLQLFPNQNIMTLSEGHPKAIFTSRLLDFGREVESWEIPIMKHDSKAIDDGAKLTLQIGVADEIGNITEWFEPSKCPPARRIKYRVIFEEGFRHDTYVPSLIESPERLEEGFKNGTKIESDTIQIDTPEYTPEGVYITKPFDLGGNIDDSGFIEMNLELPEGTNIELYSVSANTLANDFHVPTSTAPWIPLRLVHQDGTLRRYKIDSPPRTYMAFVLKLKRSSDFKTPIVWNIVFKPALFYLTRIVPTLESVQVGGFVPSGNGVEEYVVPLYGEVAADRLFHAITTDTAETLVTNYLASIGVHNIHELTLKDYVVDADPEFPIELKTELSGKSVVEARTTKEVGEIIYQEEKLYFSEDKQEIVVTPIPQTGSPIVIRNAAGVLLQQVHFRDQNFQPTLINTEYHTVEDGRHLFLQYRDYQIDDRTLHVTVDLNGDGEMKPIFGSRIEENRLVLPYQFVNGKEVIVQYKLKNSYIVDYNYQPQQDCALIKFHTVFSTESKETRRVDIRYEAKKKDAYYLADEIDVNPLYSKINAGFIYLTDEYFAPYKLKVVCNERIVYRGKKEKVLIHAYVYDENENPVVGERIGVQSRYGSIEVIEYITDANGLAIFAYQHPVDDSITKDTVEVSIIGRTTSSSLKKEIEFTILEESFAERLAIVPSKYAVESDEEIYIHVIAMGENQERISNKTIHITSSQGWFNVAEAKTGQNGEVIFLYHHPTLSQSPYVVIEATDGILTEQILLSTNGV